MNINKNGITFKVIDDAPGNPKFWDIVQQDEWESGTFKILSKFLDKNHYYIDIGAWIGPTVLYGCQLADYCYAIEPDPVAKKYLEENIKLNNFSNITIWEGAIYKENGSIEIGNNRMAGNSMSSLISKPDDPWSIPSWLTPTQTIETFMNIANRNSKSSCNFIKMDVEGSELFIIPEASKYLQSFFHTLYVSIHTPLFTSSDLHVIVDNLSLVYKYFYLDNGKEISIERIKNMNIPFNIVATKKELKTTW
jgi:FkbM family methyltransferase